MNGGLVNAIKHHHPSLEQQRRRPSSIAEQAMRKLGITNSGYTRGNDQTPRHHASITSNSDRSLEPIPSMIMLRDTNIREQAASPVATAASTLHHLRDCNGYFRGSAAYVGMTRERSECNSPFNHFSGLAANRENSCMLSNNSMPHRTPSNRLLSSGIDQRIIKQSTEDCRRLLQQVILSVFVICTTVLINQQFFRQLLSPIPIECKAHNQRQWSWALHHRNTQ